MGTATRQALAGLGYLVLGLLSAAGVALSVGFVLVSTDLGRGLVVPRLLRLADDALAGSIQLESFHLLGQGGLELVGARVVDPDGEVVLEIPRGRLYLDLARIRSKVIGVRVELDGPSVVLRREEDGSLSLARAFAPTRPSPEASTPFTWTIRVVRLTLRGGAVRYLERDGRPTFAAERLDADARAIYGPDRAGAELSLRGGMTAPERAPLALELAAGLRGQAFRLRQLRVSVGDTALEAAGELDRSSWRGRLAILALAVEASAVQKLAPRAPLAGDLTGTLYAESDGKEATAALDLRPKERGGSARAAAALRLPPGELAAGADLRLDGLDLARVLRGAPTTALHLTARAHARGKDQDTLQGALALSLAPSRVRAGRLGPAELRLSADRGAYDLSRLEATLPGLAVSGRGRYQPRGPIGGRFALAARDLAAVRANVQELLARRLPAFAGALALEGELSGSAEAPALALRGRAPSLAGPGVSAGGLSLDGRASGPLAAPRAELVAHLDRLLAGGFDARALTLTGKLAGRAGTVSVTGAVPEVGPDALALRAAGALSADGRVLSLSALSLAWPGDRFELAAPARVALDGPSVDELALQGGGQRIALTGGLRGKGAGRVLDARLRLAGLDLALLPPALRPPRLGLAGRVDADLAATGAPARPVVKGTVSIDRAALLGLDGLSARADLGYDGPRRRARVDLAARRAAGGELSVKGELPVQLGRALPREALDLALAVRDFPLVEALRVAHATPPAEVAGRLGMEVRLSGTVAAPALVAAVSLDGGRYGELDGLALAVRLAGSGHEARLSGSADCRGARALDLEGTLPVDWARFLRDPAPVARALGGAPLTLTAGVPRYDLALVAGRMGLPADLRGRLEAKAELAGTARAPRGRVVGGWTEGAVAGYRALETHLTIEARGGATALEGKASLEGEEVLRLTASLGLPVERLGERAAREAAPVEARLEVPRSDLRRAGAPVPLAGELRGTATLAGTLAAPRLKADLSGRRLELSGRPLGDATLQAQGAGGALHAELHLAVTSGGMLDAVLDAEADLGLPALRKGELGRAPARATLVASQLDLGFLPAVAPGVIRAASGKLGADLVAKGSLAHLLPRGTAALENGSMSVVEYGDWTAIALRASLSDDAFKLERLSARHGGGRLEAEAEAKGLSRKDAPADLRATLRASDLTISRAGQDLATVTVEATLTGKASAEALTAELSIPRALVRLPDRLPTRKIQPLDRREDVVVAPFLRRAAPSASGPPARTYHATVQVLVPNQFQIKGENPRVDVELKADVQAETGEGEVLLTGTVETLRGQVEPIPGRNFEVKRGRVQFTGEGYQAAVLEVQAIYDNPAAKVTVGIGGTIEAPEMKLTSQPAMDEGQIALLIATGRADLKAGTGGVQSDSVVKGASDAAIGALTQQAFRDLVADKLPVDSVSLDSTQLRAGKYLTDKIYLGYTRRFSARVEEGENTNEVRGEYQISRRWTFEGRYGDAQSGASLMWSKDY